MDETFGVGGVSRLQREAPLRQDRAGLAVMNGGGREHVQSRMVVLVVVPGKELDAERAALVVGREVCGELRSVLERFKLAFRERIVVGDMGSALRLDVPNAASNWATVCDFMDGPRSEWMVSWSADTSCLAQVSRMRRAAK